MKRNIYQVGDKVRIVNTMELAGGTRTPGRSPPPNDTFNSGYRKGEIFSVTNLQGLNENSSVHPNNYYLAKSMRDNRTVRIYHGDIELLSDIDKLKSLVKDMESEIKSINKDIEKLEKYPNPDDELVELISNTFTLQTKDKKEIHKIIKMIREF